MCPERLISVLVLVSGPGKVTLVLTQGGIVSIRASLLVLKGFDAAFVSFVIDLWRSSQ